jgi:glucose-1-phosphate thymidylyltransferase
MFGIKLSYAIQYEPKGIADAFIIGKDFIDGENVALVLGDNIFHGESMMALLEKAMRFKNGGVVFVFRVPDPERFGVAELDEHGNVLSLEEKPKHPRSNCAVTGLYFYDGDVCDIAASLKASKRGELEITDLNKVYLERKALKAFVMGGGYRWLDAGTFDSLCDATVAVREIETKKRRMISCPEEIALMQGFITPSELKERIKDKDSIYYEDLRKIADEYS